MWSKIIKTAGVVIAVIVILIGVYGLYLGMKATKMCEDQCQDKEAMGYYLIRNGDFNIHDTCVCFFKDSIKTFTLNEDMCDLEDTCELNLGFGLGGIKT